ncbi:MAG: CDP-glycerol glycerophosphotransferase family protein [Rhodothermales bacterium]
MNILVWATTFGADLWSFVKYLSERPEVNVKVVMDDPDTFMKQGVAKLFPLQVDFIRRRAHHHLFGVPSFRPDVTIMDNHLPLRRTSPKAFMMWHGFGWKGPNDEKEFKWLFRSLGRLWGDVRVPNPRFRWLCFGPWDMKHRTEVSRIHEANCRVLGAASHDDLRVPLDRKLAQPYYPFDVVGRKTVLIAPTWHYGPCFEHWGDDEVLTDRLIRRISERDANVILRLHDSYRFDRKYRSFLSGLSTRYPNVQLKFKDTSPDNYLDMQIADVLISNFSSIANLFYATERPSIHIYPVADADEQHSWRQYTITGVRTKTVDRARSIWKLPLEDNGGLLSHSFEELLGHVDLSLDDPDCCAEKSRAFLDRHMLGADGRNCERIWQALVNLVEERNDRESVLSDRS